MGTHRLWPSTNGPSTPSNYSGNFISAVSFFVSGQAWFQGYWWWVCPNSGGGDGFQPTGPTKCALWQVHNNTLSGSLVPGSVVTSGALTAGQWNYIPLATPIPLSLGGSSGTSPASATTGAPGPAVYTAAIGCNGPFPDTNNYWGSGQVAPGGITSGPLSAYSATSGSLPVPLASGNPVPQGSFSVAASDPSSIFPGSSSSTDNFWVDVQVTDTPPAGTSYRLWPGFPVPTVAIAVDTAQQTMGTEFTLSQACTLDNIWFYSPATATVLPSRCAIWKVSSQAVVSGTDNSSPSWSGAAASGWVACPYGGVTLPAGDYKVSVYYGGGAEFYAETNGYFETGAPGWNGITYGPLAAPNTTNASGGVQDTFTGGAFAYPATSGGTGGQTRWVDVEVTPAAVSGSGLLLMASFP